MSLLLSRYSGTYTRYRGAACASNKVQTRYFLGTNRYAARAPVASKLNGFWGARALVKLDILSRYIYRKGCW